MSAHLRGGGAREGVRVDVLCRCRDARRSHARAHITQRVKAGTGGICVGMSKRHNYLYYIFKMNITKSVFPLQQVPQTVWCLLS